MMASGPVFCLTADADEILRRLAARHQDRPLLDGRGPQRARSSACWRARSEAYAAIPRQIDTTGCP